MEDMKISEKLVACFLIMIGAIAVPYTGTCLAALLFTGIIYFPEIVEAIDKFDK